MLLSGFVTASSANVLQGTLFEFVKRPSRVNVAVKSDVAINAGNLYSFTIGDQIIASNAVVFPGDVNTATSYLSGIIWPDSFHIQNEPALAGDRLVLSITRAAGNILWEVHITEVL